MALRTPLSDLFGIEHPVLLAPMAGVSGGALAAAVSKAGGLGLIGGGYGAADWLEREFDAAGDARVGVGFITWSLARQPELLDLALARNPEVLMLSFGDFKPFLRKIRDTQIKLIVQVQTLEQAREAVDACVDAIVVQGTEAGGHGGARATLPLVPAVVDIAQDIPVIAAGGIADGRGLAAALALGAAGVLCGTTFFASDESLANDTAKQAAIRGSGDDTERSSVFDMARDLDWPSGWNLRTMRNSFSHRWSGDLAGLAQNLANEQDRFKVATEAGDIDVAAVIVGEAVDLVRTRDPAQTTLHEMILQAEDRLRCLSQSIAPSQRTKRMSKLKGSCLCGAVSYEVINEFDRLFLCNCDQCRQITGSAFASNLFIMADGFDWLSGGADIVSYQMPGRDISKSFCRVCGSGVPWSSGDGTKMIVPAGSLQGEPEVVDKVRIFVAEQPLWSSNLEKIEAHRGFPS